MADKHDDLKKVRELIDLMKENDLVEIEVADKEKKIHLKRPGAAITQVTMPAAAPIPAAPAETPAAEESGLAEIHSPIVGTFYAGASPDADPYIQVGDSVKPDTVVCIVEAMKVMNEIKAETTGTIAEVLMQDGQSVEYGQVLFKVRP